MNVSYRETQGSCEQWLWVTTLRRVTVIVAVLRTLMTRHQRFIEKHFKGFTITTKQRRKLYCSSLLRLSGTILFLSLKNYVEDDLTVSFNLIPVSYICYVDRLLPSKFEPCNSKILESIPC